MERKPKAAWFGVTYTWIPLSANCVSRLDILGNSRFCLITQAPSFFSQLLTIHLYTWHSSYSGLYEGYTTEHCSAAPLNVAVSLGLCALKFHSTVHTFLSFLSLLML